MKRFSLVCVLSLFASSAVADPVEEVVEVLPCRPTIACTAEIVPDGTLEIESGYAQRRGNEAALNSMLALAKYSITDRVQVQVGSNNLVAMQDGTATHALDGVFFGPKVVFTEQSENVPTLAASALFQVPTRDGAEEHTQTADAYFWIYASTDIGSIHADLNFGLDVLSLDSAPAAQFVAALSLSREIGHGVGAMLEGYTFEGGGEYAEHDAGILSGLTIALSPRVMFDIGADVALYQDSRAFTMFAGVTFVPFTTHATTRPPAVTTAAR